MKIKYFATTWGLEGLEFEAQFKKIKEAGYDGVETGRIQPAQVAQVLELLDKYQLLLICQQWTEGKNFKEHMESFLKQVIVNTRLKPLSINSHTGKDHFEIYKNIKILQECMNIENSLNVPITHETHRGRFGYAAHVTSEFLEIIPKLKLTADFSHWCCVAESYLEDQENNVTQAINNSFHIHARIGSTQASQVNDPASPEWEKEKKIHLDWWKKIVAYKNSIAGILPITCEFGPAPYMPTHPGTGNPISSQWQNNLYMKTFLKQHFQDLELTEDLAK